MAGGRKFGIKERKSVYTKDEKLKVEIIWLHYIILVAEYGERWKIIELVTKSYWWSDITKDVKKYVNRCNIYYKIKN